MPSLERLERINCGLKKTMDNVWFVKICICEKNVDKPSIKKQISIKMQSYRNLLPTLMKNSKVNYYKKFFEFLWSIITNTWKGIKTKQCNFECTGIVIP